MKLLFSYYGDDFTGSTDALEALAAQGVPAVLFLKIPEPGILQQFDDYQAVGIAGESRSRPPQWMEEFLPPIFQWLRSLGAPIVQYKVCSTFDSSPTTGNIAVAMRIGRQVFGSGSTPVVVAAPHLRRYVLFGNLFAAAGEDVYRIDRHPTMRNHPVTPMHESDLRLHLAAQDPGTVRLLDILTLTDENAAEAFEHMCSGDSAAVVFDGMDERTELATGKILWEKRAQFQFVAGSSGLTHALMRYWREHGIISQTFTPARAKAVDRLIVVSGSCSPITEMQIQSALGNGFEGICAASRNPEETLREGLEILAAGKSLILYSALGSHRINSVLTGDDLGRHLGKLLRQLVVQSGVLRAVIAGGDTSTHATQQLGIDALTFAAQTAPGAPLCATHSKDPAMTGLELVLKGGQVGNSDFFERVLKGY